MFNFLQAPTIQLGVRLRDSGHLLALVQEPYVDLAGRITGVPSGMRAFSNRSVFHRFRGQHGFHLHADRAACHRVWSMRERNWKFDKTGLGTPGRIR